MPEVNVGLPTATSDQRPSSVGRLPPDADMTAVHSRVADPNLPLVNVCYRLAKFPAA
jgi:hypothetical protein